MMTPLSTMDELKSRRKDYRILHRRLITLLRYEYSAFNTMRRFYTGEKPPRATELAEILNVSSKTIRRHMSDISTSDLTLLTGQYAFMFGNRKPDDLVGILTDLTGIGL